ncbi:hypothetical protein KUCAC02_029926, partial [Chaenocephalus aceratus]
SIPIKEPFGLNTLDKDQGGFSDSVCGCYVWGCCRLLRLASKIHNKTRTGVQSAAQDHRQ